MTNTVLVCIGNAKRIMFSAIVSIVLLFANASAASAEAKVITPAVIADPLALSSINVDSASIDDVEKARFLLTRLLPESANFSDPNSYCLLHIVKWGEPSSKGQLPAQQHWYVVPRGRRDWTNADLAGTRLYGTRHVSLVYVHLNLQASVDLASYAPTYEITSEGRTKAPVQHAKDLLTLFPGAARQELAGGGKAFWGWSGFDVQDPSDITAKASVKYAVSLAQASSAPTPGAEARVNQPSPATVPLVAEGSLGDPVKFDNEGLYRWDVSVGVPIRGIKELTIDPKTGEGSPTNVDRANILALFDFYIRPVDIHGGSFTYVPHFVGGVTVTDKPLNKLMAGIAWSPIIADFYVGALWVKKDIPGSTSREYDLQFTFGLNVPVRFVMDKFKSQTAKTTE